MLFSYFGMRLIIGPFMVCGFAFGCLFEPYLHNKTPLSGTAVAGILLVTLLFLVWNIVLYRRARIDPDPAFPTRAYERYTPAVAASLSFLVGASIVLFS